MIKAVFLLSLLFVYEDGSIVPGNKVDGWGDRPFTTKKECLDRSKFLYKHKPKPLPRGVVDLVSFCKVTYTN